MGSTNLVDFLAEKIFSFSSKMRDDSLQQFNALLMSGNSISHDPSIAVSVLKKNFPDFEGSNSFYSHIFHQALRVQDSIHSFNFFHNLERSDYIFSYKKSGLFSPHLLDLISVLNSKYRNIYADLPLASSNNIFFENLFNDLSPQMYKKQEADFSIMSGISPATEFMPLNVGRSSTDLFPESPKLKESAVDFNSNAKVCSSTISEVILSLSIDQLPTDLYSESPKMIENSANSNTKVCSSPSVVTMSHNISEVPASNPPSESCNLSTGAKLSLKLANRKAKQMNKRSKKRRRRQKKSLHSADTLSGNGSTKAKNQCPVSSCECFIAESPDFECSISFQHSVQGPSCLSSFVVPVESKSDDDSEWESYDETDHCKPNNSTSNDEVDFIVSSSDSSPVKSAESQCSVPSMKLTSSIVSFVVPVESNSDDDSDWEFYDETDHCKPNNSTSSDEVDFILSSSDTSPVKSTESKCSVPSMKLTSSIVSFVVPDSDSSDDDSDWDTCEPDALTEIPDFEFTGLFLTNLCTPQTVFLSAESKSSGGSKDMANERFPMNKMLVEVNENWNNLTEGDPKPKSTSKVTFAPDENLVEVFPVEMYERKGEWEMYATDRIRFKRKIDELEKVLSPCLHPEHRSKVFKKLMESEL